MNQAELAIIIKAHDQTQAALRSVQQKVGGLSGFMRTAGSVAGGFLGANIISGLLKSGIDQIGSFITEAFDAEKIRAQTESVLKSTQGVANVTLDQVTKLADGLQAVTVFDDEAVQSAENLLLTFTKIQGQETFEGATRAVLDMATAMGTDATTAALQIGKALNDPIRGVTALRRAGVQLTKEQEANIKRLVDAGKLQEAQQIILNELQTEFGGSAEAAGQTAAGSWQRLMNMMNELKETLGTALLPTIQRVANNLTEFIVTHQPQIQELADTIATDLADAFEAISKWFEENEAEIDAALKDFAQFVRDLRTAWVEIEPVVARLFAIWQNEIETKLRVFRDIFRIAGALWRGDWSAVWAGIRQLASDAFEGIKTDTLLKLNNLWQLVKTPITGITGAITGAFSDAAAMVSRIVAGMANGVIDAINGILEAAREIDRALPEAVSPWDVPGNIGHIGGGGTNRPVIADSGGIFTGPTLAALAMNGRPEAVIPLDRMGGLGGPTIHIEHLHAANGEDFIDQVERAISRRRWRGA